MRNSMFFGSFEADFWSENKNSPPPPNEIGVRVGEDPEVNFGEALCFFCLFWRSPDFGQKNVSI